MSTAAVTMDISAEIGPGWDEAVELAAVSQLRDIGGMYRRWSDGIDDFRAELEALRDSGIFDVHLADPYETNRRRTVLAPLAGEDEPSPAEPVVTPEQYMAAPELLEPTWRQKMRERYGRIQRWRRRR